MMRPSRLLLLAAAPVLAFAGWLAFQLAPLQRSLALPAAQIALDSTEGQALLASAARADLPALQAAFQSQQLTSWCGPASAVTVLGAAGSPRSQWAFFADGVKPAWRVALGGMTLDELAAGLRVHGVGASAAFAEGDNPTFRATLAANLTAPEDWLIVNYDRRVLGQDGAGHISPIGAYSVERDMALVLDVSTYKYPAHWVAVDVLYAAMQSTDGSSGRSRGWVVVTER